MSPPLAPASGDCHARIEIRRPHVGVLVERAPDGQQQPVERGVVGDLRMPHGAQQDGVARLQQVDGPGGHHAPPAEKVLRAPFEILKREGHVMFPGDLLQNALGLGHDLGPDAVAGDHCDGECLHGLEDNFSRPFGLHLRALRAGRGL